MPEEKKVGQKLLEILQWLLPIALSFIGWYVSTVVAPLDRELKSLESTIESCPTDMKELQTQRDEVFRRLEKIEDDVENIKTSVIHQEFKTLTQEQVRKIIKESIDNVNSNKH